MLLPHRRPALSGAAPHQLVRLLHANLAVNVLRVRPAPKPGSCPLVRCCVCSPCVFFPDIVFPFVPVLVWCCCCPYPSAETVFLVPVPVTFPSPTSGSVCVPYPVMNRFPTSVTSVPVSRRFSVSVSVASPFPCSRLPVPEARCSPMRSPFVFPRCVPVGKRFPVLPRCVSRCSPFPFPDPAPVVKPFPS